VMGQLQDLTLHVGLPKTGTTTLQREVFPKFRGYVCGTESSGPSGDLAQQMLRLYQVKGAHRDWNTDVWRSEAIAWWAQARATSDGPLLVSLEGLYRWFDPVTGMPWPLMGNGEYRSHRIGSHPLLSFLAALQNQFDNCRLRVAITLRNQASFLASHYAQISYRLSYPSQKDFEAKARHVTNKGDPFFDWFDTVDQLVKLVGRDNVHLNLFEKGLNSIAKDLSVFLAARWTPLPVVTRLNSRGSDGGWTLSTPQYTRGRRAVRAFRPRISFNSVGPTWRRPWNFSLSIGTDNPSKITISREMQSELRSAFTQSNANLSSLLDDDLSKYGYI